MQHNSYGRLKGLRGSTKELHPTYGELALLGDFTSSCELLI